MCDFCPQQNDGYNCRTCQKSGCSDAQGRVCSEKCKRLRLTRLAGYIADTTAEILRLSSVTFP